eukprot:CAMPEP_0170471452 /NCGR_PEP_ID=MMETSP0123-20130129/13666_1 /TAXON_ID=182087 /ORGANISM="Favella ehrenbergii, Strain Fehren 1" /LENGTH=78 /DNA_ID=CAMNT_0010739103 /DNA_START=591 /DNA_END=827 /DNA_ORIENTATION=+
MPSEPSLSDRYRSEHQAGDKGKKHASGVAVNRGNVDAVRRTMTQSSNGDGAHDSGRVVVMTENAEEVSIAHVGVAFEH